MNQPPFFTIASTLILSSSLCLFTFIKFERSMKKPEFDWLSINFYASAHSLNTDDQSRNHLSPLPNMGQEKFCIGENG